jgi:hypothetical protein
MSMVVLMRFRDCVSRTRAVSGLVVLCLVATTFAVDASVPAHATSPVQGHDFFGMNAEYVFRLPETEWGPQLAAIAALGIDEVREDANWSGVEHAPPVDGQHRYEWTRPDAMISALARHDLRWYPILDYSAKWDVTRTDLGLLNWKSAPATPAYFADYAAAFARRYGAGGSFWTTHPSLPQLPVQTFEVWNEPNLEQFWPTVKGAADRYGELLAATLPAIRAADPSGHVVVGGLSPTGLVEFLNEIEARNPGLIAQANAVAFHPYGTTFANTGGRIRVLREWLDQHGDDSLPIEITETGWATPPLSEAERATRMRTLVQGLATSSCDITRIIPYTWLTFEREASNPEEWFGIANANATLKPSGVALSEAMQAVESGTETPMSDPCAGLRAPLAPVEERPLGEQPTEETSSSETSTEPTAPVVPEHETSASGPESQGAFEEPGVAPSVAIHGALTPTLAAATLPAPSSSTISTTSTQSSAQSAAGRRKQAASVVVRVRRRPRMLIVEVECPRVCRSVVRLTGVGHRARSKAGRVLERRHRATLPLAGIGRGALILRVTAQGPGVSPQAMVRRLS